MTIESLLSRMSKVRRREVITNGWFRVDGSDYDKDDDK
jgi:hypothetical protein